VLAAESCSYLTCKRLVEQRTLLRAASETPVSPLMQSVPAIRSIDDYHRFFDAHTTEPSGGSRCQCQ
jgi:hypothetical protein